jgi:hypothetical protein
MTRVARWYIFKPKIPIWVYLGGPWNGKCWYFLVIWNILQPFVISYGHLVHFVVIWYICYHFSVFTNKNLATLSMTAATINHNFKMYF